MAPRSRWCDTNFSGILRDVSFIKMKQADWDLIYKVHLQGAYSVSKAAWPYMRDQGFGTLTIPRFISLCFL